ncbi:MAG: hypothetical protein ABIJ21_01535 [Nanoarchaeota archaeon]
MEEQQTEFLVPGTDRSTYAQPPADRSLYKKVKDMVGIRGMVVTSKNLEERLNTINEVALRKEVDANLGYMPENVRETITPILAKVKAYLGDDVTKVIGRAEKKIDKTVEYMDRFIAKLQGNVWDLNRDRMIQTTKLQELRTEEKEFLNYQQGLSEDLSDIESVLVARTNNTDIDPSTLPSGEEYVAKKSAELKRLEYDLKTKLTESKRLTERVYINAERVGNNVRRVDDNIDRINTYIDEANIGINDIMNFMADAMNNVPGIADQVGPTIARMFETAQQKTKGYVQILNGVNEAYNRFGGLHATPSFKHLPKGSELDKTAQSAIKEEMEERKRRNSERKEHSHTAAEGYFATYLGPDA